MRIGFKTSKHTGQQFLTFRPAKVVYSYTIGGQPYTPKSGQFINATIGEYADYGDFLKFSASAFIDPVVEAAAKKMGENFAAELDKMLNVAVTSNWEIPKFQFPDTLPTHPTLPTSHSEKGNGTPTTLYHPYTTPITILE